MDSQEQNKALSRAKIGMMTKDSAIFWSTVCMGLKHVFDESIPTACTNGVYIKYNPDFFMNECKSNEERTGLVFHENGHVVLQHISRRGDRDPITYNMAGDYVINLMGIKAGFKFPAGALLDHKYDGWSTEQVYDDLINNPPPQRDTFQIDLIDDGEADSADGQQQIDDLLVKAVMAADAANQSGSVPEDVRRYVSELLYPIIPWNSIFRRFMTQFDKSRYNYKLPNRRYFPDIFLPKRKARKVGKIAMAIDASASVSDREFTNYVSGAHSILTKYKPESLEFLQFTTRITARQDIKSTRDLTNIQFVGRGGTSIHPVMDWAKEHNPALLIIFSDGQFNQPYLDPKVPIVWIIHNNPSFTVPFGKVIHFNIV